MARNWSIRVSLILSQVGLDDPHADSFCGQLRMGRRVRPWGETSLPGLGNVRAVSKTGGCFLPRDGHENMGILGIIHWNPWRSHFQKKRGYQEFASFFADSFAVINSGKETFLMTLILKDLQIEWQKDLIDLWIAGFHQSSEKPCCWEKNTMEVASGWAVWHGVLVHQRHSVPAVGHTAIHGNLAWLSWLMVYVKFMRSLNVSHIPSIVGFAPTSANSYELLILDCQKCLWHCGVIAPGQQGSRNSTPSFYWQLLFGCNKWVSENLISQNSMVSNIMFPSRFDFWGLNIHFQVPTPNDAFTTMGLYELYEKLTQPCLTWTLVEPLSSNRTDRQQSSWPPSGYYIHCFPLEHSGFIS